MKIAGKQRAARQHILEAARPLIGQRGFSAVGLAQILEVAGIPKGSFYHYFESKEAFGEDSCAPISRTIWSGWMTFSITVKAMRRSG